MTIRQATVPWQRGYDFGVGVDLVSGSPMARVVTDAHDATAEAGGAKVDFSIDRVRTTADLERALGIHAEASYGSVAFGAGVKARFDMAKRSAIQTTSLFMSVTAMIELEFLSIDDPQLTSDAAELALHQTEFEQRFGNVFVRGVSRGGLFVGILKVDTRSAQDTETIAAELHGSYGLFSADAQVKFQEIQSKYQASSFVRMYHEGGPIDLEINDPTDPMQLLANANLFLKSFKDDPRTHSVPYQVTLAPITIAKGPTPLTSAQIQHVEDILTFCAKQRSTRLDQLNLLQYILDNPARFELINGASTEAVAQAAGNAQEDLDLIASCATNAIRNPAEAELPATFAERQGTTYPKTVLPNPLPVPKVTEPLVAVPNVLGAGARSPAIGHSLLLQAGLQPQDDGPREITDSSGQTLRGFIVNQDPTAGTMVPRGSVVTLTIGDYRVPGGIKKLGTANP